MKQFQNQITSLTTSLFKRSKKSTAVLVVLLSLFSSNLTVALDSHHPLVAVQGQEAIPPIVNNQQKFRTVDAGQAIKDQYIVVLKDQFVSQQAITMAGGSTLSKAAAMNYRRQVVQDVAAEVANLHNAKVVAHYHAALAGFAVKMNQADVKKLLSDNRVAFVEQDQIMQAIATQFGATWGLDRVDQPDLPLNSEYNYTEDGSGVSAYIVDTGILSSHSDFGGRVTAGFTAINDGNGTNDCNGHGTHVTGSVGSNTYGVAKNVSLIPVRVLNCAGSGTNSGVIAGVDWVAQNAVLPAVANMSLGGGSSTALDSAVQNAISQGILFVVAAGNDNSDACVGSPNRVPEALTIASSTSSDTRSSFSNWGSCVDLFAPGSSITSTWNNGSSNTISGTSMASPHVAGAVALYLQNNTGAIASQVATAIVNNAASGRISNANGSPNLLLQTQPGDAPPPPPPPGNELVNGVAVTGLSASTGNDIMFTMDVPAGATNISFNMSGGTGDADLYVKFGSPPTDTSYDCRPFFNGNNETCTGTQTGGTYYVRVKAFSSFSGVSLVGSYTEPGAGPDPIDATVSNISVAQGNWVRFTLELVSGYSTLAVSISGGTGDADLYVRFGAPSTTFSYDCRPFLFGNEETCTFNNPAAGTWHIDIHGFTSASGVTLNAKAN